MRAATDVARRHHRLACSTISKATHFRVTPLARHLFVRGLHLHEPVAVDHDNSVKSSAALVTARAGFTVARAAAS